MCHNHIIFLKDTKICDTRIRYYVCEQDHIPDHVSKKPQISYNRKYTKLDSISYVQGGFVIRVILTNMEFKKVVYKLRKVEVNI